MWFVADLGVLEVRDSLNPMIMMIRLVLLGLLITLCRFMLLLMDPYDVRNDVHCGSLTSWQLGGMVVPLLILLLLICLCLEDRAAMVMFG